MFGLLVGLEVKNGQQSMPLSRIYFKESSNPLSEEVFNQLEKEITIIMKEGAPHNGESAHFVKLNNFVFNGRDLDFHVTLDPNLKPFSASVLESNKAFLGIDSRWEWKHTCWQRGSGDIFEALYRSSNLILENRPTLFNFNEPRIVKSNQIACMMPFASEFDDVYASIKVACKTLNYDCVRVDEIYSNTPIIEDVVKLIDESAMIISDLSGRNPNVMYETGIAHAIGREVIIIAQDISEDVPFDLRHLRCVGYSGVNQEGRDKLGQDLIKSIKCVRDKQA